MADTAWRAAPRQKPTSAGVGRLGVVLLALLVVGYLAFTLSVLLRPSGEVYLWADLGAYNGVFALAAALLILRGVRGSVDDRPWTLIGIALALNAVGGVVWSMDDAWGLPQTFIPIPDLFWIAFYPLAFIALLRLGRMTTRKDQQYGLLDSLMVGSGAFTLGLVAIGSALAIDPAIGMTPEYLINAFYLLGDLVLIAMLITVAQAYGWRLPMSWTLLLAGLAVYAFGDALYLVAVSNSTYVEGSIIDLLWPTACLLFGFAAAVGSSPRGIRHETPLHLHRARVIVPSLAVLTSAAVLLAGAVGWLTTTTWLVFVFASVTILLGVIRLDLTLRAARRLSEELREARLDPATGLPNRRALSTTTIGSLIVIDIVDTSSYNQSLGAERTDRMLITIAQRLRDAVRSEDLVARSAGDEFSILMEQTRIDDAIAVAEGLVRVVEEPLEIDGIQLHVTACAGVAAAEGAGQQSAIDLLSDATEALRRAKSQGPGLVRAQDGVVGERSFERLQRRAAIRRALTHEAHEIVPYFQPIVDIHNNDVLVCESLVRWHHEGHVLLPDQFLGDLAQSASLPDLTIHMLNTSLEAIATSGLHYPVAVNVPPELVTHELVEHARDAIRHARVDANKLFVEVTETAILRDPKATAAVLNELRKMGVRILLDDFGTGWSGLSSLRDLGIDGLKLDYSFVSLMATDPTTAAIVRGVAGVAAELGIFVIYEGVEDPEVSQAVSALDTGYVQGFAVARPMPIDGLKAWAHTHSVTSDY